MAGHGDPDPVRAEREAHAALRRSQIAAKEAERTLTFQELLGKVGHQQDQSVDVRLVACRFFYYLVEKKRDREHEKEGGDADAKVALRLALSLLDASGPDARDAHRHGGRLLAAEARTAKKKLALAEAGAIEKLARALKDAPNDAVDAITNVLHALFNISTHPATQVRTVKAALKPALRHARGSPAGVAPAEHVRAYRCQVSHSQPL